MQMGDTPLVSNADDLFSLYLSTPNEAEAESALSQLISLHVTSLIHQIVNYKLRAGIGRNTVREADAEEVCSQALLKILEKLQQWRLSSENKETSHFMD